MSEAPALTPDEIAAIFQEWVKDGVKRCRNCGVIVNTRVGRGLCRQCWNDPAIRAAYPPLAPFGGKAANAYNRPLPKT
jgi:hypothetical protein